MPRLPPASGMPGCRIRRSNRSICGAGRKSCTRARCKARSVTIFYHNNNLCGIIGKITLSEEEKRMPPAKRRVVAVQPQEAPPVQATPAPQRRVGRPPGEASTIVNIRLPLSLVAQLDHYLDRLAGPPGPKPNPPLIP